MSQPFIGQIGIFGFNFPPRGWALCQGQLLSIQQNAALFSILGTTYGGNGTNNFALPSLRGRTPMHTGGGFVLGEAGGTENVTLLSTQIPAHTHTMVASSQAPAATDATNNFFAQSANSFAGASNATSTLSAITGASIPHPNLSPYLTINFCIALQGIFPSRN